MTDFTTNPGPPLTAEAPREPMSDLSPESRAEIDAFRDHLIAHKRASAPDCRFCDERDAKKPPPPPQPDHLPVDEVLRDVLIVDGVCAECRDGALCGFHATHGDAMSETRRMSNERLAEIRQSVAREYASHTQMWEGRALTELLAEIDRQRSSPSLGELGTLHRCMGDSCAVVLPLAEIRHHSVRHDHAYDPTPVGTEREFARLHHVIDMAAIHATSAGVNYLHDDCRKARAFVAALDARLAALVAAQRDVEEMLAGLLDRTSHGIGDCPRAWVIDNVRDILDVARAAHPPEGSHGR
jgi:hypothetical protein